MKSFFPFLSFSIWIPIIMGFLVISTNNYKNNNIKRYISIISAIISFIFTIPLIFYFKNNITNYQFLEYIPWIKFFNINYFIGIDGISLWFIPLTSLTTIFVILIEWKNIKKNISQYFGSILILSGLIIGVFSSLDAMLFYIFLETTLIPIFIIIGIWGGKKRIYAAFKFFLYTFLGSILILLVFIYLYIKTNSFNIYLWYKIPLSMIEQILIFIIFFIAFAIKLPVFPFHTWLPNAHVEASTGGSIILAGIMLKFGAYGFLRFILPITPIASMFFSKIITILSLFSIVYVGLITIIQKNMKKLIAYSSINHMGIVILGIFVFKEIGINGSIIQMISHIFTSTAMFSLIGILYSRTHSKKIKFYELAKKMPIFSVFFVIISLANCGLPITSGFVGEFMVIISAIKYNIFIGIIASTIFIWSAIYSLWLVKKIIFNKNKKNISSKKYLDINKREFYILIFITLPILIIGIYPKIIINKIQFSILTLLKNVIVKNNILK